MMPVRYRIARLVFATAIAIVLPGQLAFAQDDLETEIKVELAPRLQAREKLIQLQLQRVLLSQKRNLENWIARSFGTAGGLRDHLETCLKSQLEDLSESCHLTESQRKKLQLAGRGDIKRLMDRLDSIREKCTHADASELQIVTGAIGSAISDLREDVEGPFRRGSLFDKTLVTTLTAEQIVQRENSLRDKNLVRYRQAVGRTVRRLATLSKLSTGQSNDLVRLILTETTPPLRFGRSDDAFVMFQTSRLPAAKLREIFLDWQWQTIHPQLVSWGHSEQALRDEGFEFSSRSQAVRPAVLEPAVNSAPEIELRLREPKP